MVAANVIGTLAATTPIEALRLMKLMVHGVVLVLNMALWLGFILNQEIIATDHNAHENQLAKAYLLGTPHMSCAQGI